MNRTEYIHYGHKHFDKDLFKEIKNIIFVKPEGGLWASDVNSKNGWKEWTEAENYRTDTYRDDNYFKFKLKDNAKVLTLKTKDDLKRLPKNKVPTFPIMREWLDFEKLAKHYDAIEVFIEKLYWDLYGWDCDSLLVLNKEVVEEIEDE